MSKKFVTKFKCAVCGKLTAGRMPREGRYKGDTSARFPRRHNGNDGKPCEGNLEEATWVTLKTLAMTDKKPTQLKKHERKMVFDKYNGHCAYCGCELQKGWHISKILSESPIVDNAGNFIIPNDTLENKIPSCASCNMSRTIDNGGVTFISIEEFRKQLYDNLKFIQSFAYYQRALRFGMITETNIEVKFYFETFTNLSQTTPI